MREKREPSGAGEVQDPAVVPESVLGVHDVRLVRQVLRPPAPRWPLVVRVVEERPRPPHGVVVPRVSPVAREPRPPPAHVVYVQVGRVRVEELLVPPKPTVPRRRLTVSALRVDAVLRVAVEAE